MAVKFFSGEGISPDPQNVRAICNLKPPEDKKSLQSILVL